MCLSRGATECFPRVRVICRKHVLLRERLTHVDCVLTPRVSVQSLVRTDEVIRPSRCALVLHVCALVRGAGTRVKHVSSTQRYRHHFCFLFCFRVVFCFVVAVIVVSVSVSVFDFDFDADFDL